MDAGVAQQAEQLIRNQQVTSSNLVAGSKWLCEAFNSNHGFIKPSKNPFKEQWTLRFNHIEIKVSICFSDSKPIEDI
jgi:hypothetical protein